MQGPKQRIIAIFCNGTVIAALSRNLIWVYSILKGDGSTVSAMTFQGRDSKYFKIFLLLFFCNLHTLIEAQPIITKKEQNSLRINAYASLITGSSSGSKVGGKSGTFEFFNYHIQNVTQAYQINAGTNDYVVNSFKNEFTWHLGKYLKIHTINSFSFSPINSYSYLVNQFQPRPNQPSQERVERVQIKSKDQYTQNGVQLSLKLNNMSLGAMFIYLDRQSFRTMNARQYAFTLESNPYKKVGLKANLGGMQNSYFSDKMNYFESELRISINRNFKLFLNANKGSTRMYYSLLDGGFTLFNEDMLKSIIGLKTEFNLTPYLGGFIKAEKYNFKNSSVNFFYFGISYKIKPY